MDIATMIEDWINDQLDSIFVSYTLNERIHNGIEYRLKMLLETYSLHPQIFVFFDFAPTLTIYLIKKLKL
jgi:hypothetical protein